jgi:REP element-mobilizing transposase RayT
MPNHIHGILFLIDNNDISREHYNSVGAGLADNFAIENQNLFTKPAPTNNLATENNHGIPEIIRGFKTFSARRVNQIRHTSGIPVWQRNYYDHIIRDETSLQKIRQYIQTNPNLWQVDQLHPNNPSKW